MECVIKSLGYGVYHVTAPDALSAREAIGQVGRVLEVWSDPEGPGSHAAALETGFPTSRWEASIAADPEVASSVRRSASSSPPDSRIRLSLALVSKACSKLLGEAHDPSLLSA
jgi:hypothetical protein